MKKLEGSCRCGAVDFDVMSHTPYPYQLCYCSICRKTAGGGGFAINLMGDATTLHIRGKKNIRIFHARIADDEGHCHTSKGERNFCVKCATALWMYDPEWPELMHPFASVIDTALPTPPS
ncbi:MAG TPA: GFA family protein, partial [Rhizomicrobium sp.]|nr:GFA family protein [Rhizomicrobium sp.]